MRIYVPSRVPLTPRERIARDIRFLGRCACMGAAGAGFGLLLLQFGFAVGAVGEIAMARL